MKVAVVVDSSAGLPPEVARGQQVTVVPLSVTLDGRRLPETGVDLAQVLDRSAQGRRTVVEAPGRDAFVACYRALGEQGYDEVVSIHLPESLGPVVLQARGAAEQLRAEDGVAVHVVDGQVTAMGLGWVALTSAGAARSSMTGREVQDLALMTAARTLLIYATGDAAHLRRFGRGQQRRSLVRSAVGAQPVFRLQRGEVSPAGTPLGQGRAIDRMVELAEENGRGWPMHVTVQDAGAPEAAHTLRERLLDAGMHVQGDISIVPVSPSVAAVTGAGTVGLTMSPTEWLTDDDRLSTVLS